MNRARTAEGYVVSRIVDLLSGVGILLFARLGWERGFRAMINAFGVEHGQRT